MKIILNLLLSLILAGFPLTTLFAQQDILSANGNSTGIAGTVSWSVGLVAYATCSSTTGTLTQGIQQPYEIFIIEGLEEPGPGPECIIFPNPTTGTITLKFADQNLKNLTSGLYDAEGTRLLTIPVNASEISVRMDDFEPSTYILVILENDKPVKSYKIIKK